MTADVVWRSLPITVAELSLARVLRCGQAFRWKKVNNIWRFATRDNIVLLRQDEEKIEYGCCGVSGSAGSSQYEAALDSVLRFIQDYFNLSVKVTDLYKQWAAVEKKYVKQEMALFSYFPGIRMLRQDPWETVVLFICSSNNNVKRISKMCDTLCDEYGKHVGDYEGASYFSFPGPEKLCGPEVEGHLRELGFGYRAKYIQQTAAMFIDDAYPDITLESLSALRGASYEDAHQYLLQLKGVGPKVADCICLMALDKHDVVPVDTHVSQIAVRDYKFKKPKTMNAKTYHEVRVHLQNLFGTYAGWAQLVMFAADLSDLNNGVNEVNGVKTKHEVSFEMLRTEQKLVIVSEPAAKRIKTEA